MRTSGKLITFLLQLLVTVNGLPAKQAQPFDQYVQTLTTEMNNPATDAILFWNSVMLQACANDYDRTIVPASDQVGPTSTSRAFAIIHGAMYEAFKACNQKSPSKKYYVDNNVPKHPTTEAAIMEAAYQTLIAMYPQQIPMFDQVRTAYLQKLQNGNGVKNPIKTGISVGQLVAHDILQTRSSDNSQNAENYIPNYLPGYHQPDPVNPNQGYLSVQWGHVKPFAIKSGSQFRASNIVGETANLRLNFLKSNNFLDHFDEVKVYGAKNSTVRTGDQTEIGIFWAYDGAPKIGVPPRLYNQIVRVIAIQQKNKLDENALLFAMINYAMADAGISAWESKYYYNLWRPIIGIRQAPQLKKRDPNWEPFGAPIDNNGTNFTPSFPSYVSGHATFGSSVFQVLRLFYNTDSIAFSFQSDEFNGKTYDSIQKKVRSMRTRRYQSFTQAEVENFLSRIYLGVHWRIDQEGGQIMGRNVGTYVYNKLINDKSSDDSDERADQHN